MFGDGRDPVSQQRWVEFRNASGQDIPSFGVLQITGSETLGVGRKVLTVTRPDGTAGATYAINGHLPVAAGSTKGGVCTMSWPANAAYDTGDGTPAINEVWGAKSGQFTLAKAKAGFKIAGTPENGRVLVVGIFGEGFDMIEGQLKTAMTSGDVTHTMDNIIVYSGADPRTDPTSSTEEITITNTFGWDADDDAIAQAKWDRTNSVWKLTQVECPA